MVVLRCLERPEPEYIIEMIMIGCELFVMLMMMMLTRQHTMVVERERTRRQLFVRTNKWQFNCNGAKTHNELCQNGVGEDIYIYIEREGVGRRRVIITK